MTIVNDHLKAVLDTKMSNKDLSVEQSHFFIKEILDQSENNKEIDDERCAGNKCADHCQGKCGCYQEVCCREPDDESFSPSL